MLTRRQLLTTIAAAPLAKFCKTETVRPYDLTNRAPDGYLNDGTPYWWAEIPTRRIMRKSDVERRYALPQGALG